MFSYLDEAGKVTSSEIVRELQQMMRERAFSGYDQDGQPLYRDTADGAQCAACGLMGGSHGRDCPHRGQDEP